MYPLGNTHVLIIEDDPVSVDVLRSLLEQVGASYTVLARQNKEAILNAPPADVVFLDLEMPELNGYDVLQILKSIETFKNVPVVAYTTHVSHMNGAREAGFHSFLAKPLNRHQFQEQLEKILNGQSVWEA